MYNISIIGHYTFTCDYLGKKIIYMETDESFIFFLALELKSKLLFIYLFIFYILIVMIGGILLWMSVLETLRGTG
jgi:hypothetical protein